jgi:uncharacterized repeat protein (TIGR03943 family)
VVTVTARKAVHVAEAEHHHGQGDESHKSLMLVLIGVVAVIVARLAIGGGYAAFVRVGMRWPLIASAIVLAGLAIAELAVGRDDRHNHIRPGIYLLAPILLAFAVAPQPLGSFAAERSNVVPSPTSPFSALDVSNSPVELTLLEFSQRALDRDGATLRDVSVRLTGFVMATAELRIARFRVACCAADGQAAVVKLDLASHRPAADHWVTVDGTYTGFSGDVPVLTVDRLEPIAQPADPYEPA